MIAPQGSDLSSLPETSPLELPDKIYPEYTWAFQKGSPKTSLESIGQSQTAKQSVLNLIELIHWASFLWDSG